MDLPTVDRPLTTTRSAPRRLDLARPVAPETIEERKAFALQASRPQRPQHDRSDPRAARMPKGRDSVAHAALLPVARVTHANASGVRRT